MGHFKADLKGNLECLLELVLLRVFFSHDCAFIQVECRRRRGLRRHCNRHPHLHRHTG
jgi:hypothetical protein